MDTFVSRTSPAVVKVPSLSDQPCNIALLNAPPVEVTTVDGSFATFETSSFT